MSRRIYLVVLTAWLCHFSLGNAQEFRIEQVDFFERSVRPLLSQRCYECHGASAQEGGLRLDNRAALLEGGDRGPAITLGQPDKSLLIQAVSYHVNDLAMPPEGKLSAQQITDLRGWIEQRAPWPAEETNSADNVERRSAQQHWAYQPIHKPSLPRVQQLGWAKNEIDLFILDRLEQRGLEPSARASHETLSRRIHLDLIGLPPSRIASKHESISDLTDRLLASPRYGERWARHWLDVARYADTRGYVDGGQAKFAFAYTFRDYVIRAFNDDLPFDQFVLDQLAADQREYAINERWRLAAMGFLTVGRRFNHNYHDMLDDQIDVISRGLQGVTVSCARCHDHKYDPIPTADYYSLYGILASSDEPQHPDLPTLGSAQDDHTSKEHLAELRKRATEYDAKFNRLYETIQHEIRGFAADYLVYLVQESPRHRIGDQNPLKTSRTILRGPTAYGFGAIRRWRQYINSSDADDPIFGIWHSMDVVSNSQFESQLKQQLAREDVSPIIKQQLMDDQPRSMVELAQSYGTAFESSYAECAKTSDRAHEPSQIESPAIGSAAASMRAAVFDSRIPITITLRESIDCYHLDEHTEMRNLAGKVEEASISNAQAQARAMVLRRRAQPYQPAVFIRGQPNRLGRQVPRQIPTVFSGVAGERLGDLAKGDDRLSLAQWIVDRRNPLTARVFVNRVWHWHFGQPLVDTVSDFGIRSVSPTHPELLDYLAVWFMEHGWSLKKLHRLIVNSNTYQQASLDRHDSSERDPENRLLWRYNARRLEWEVIRDSLLFVSGQLEHRTGGRAIAVEPDDPTSTCRTIFLHIDRQHLPPFARNFDFPSPDFTSPQRPITTVPQQQLFFLNSPFVAKQAERLGHYVAHLKTDDVSRFQALYQRIFASSSANDHQKVRDWLNTLETTNWESDQDKWAWIAHALLQSNPFVFME